MMKSMLILRNVLYPNINVGEKLRVNLDWKSVNIYIKLS